MWMHYQFFQQMLSALWCSLMLTVTYFEFCFSVDVWIIPCISTANLHFSLLNNLNVIIASGAVGSTVGCIEMKIGKKPQDSWSILYVHVFYQSLVHWFHWLRTDVPLPY